MPAHRAFLACSLDGFIAGPNDELDWLTPPSPIEDTFSPFLAEIGALLMGRRTYDVLAGIVSAASSGPDGAWPYGDRPVLVATSRPLAPLVPRVRAVAGELAALVATAHAAAGPRDVYVDGGELVRASLAAGLLDELTITWVPVALGAGKPLLAGLTRRVALELLATRPLGAGFLQCRYRPLPEVER